MKKLVLCLMATFLASVILVGQTKAGKVDTVSHGSYYSCPNHSDVTSHQPGKCSKCGMELNFSKKEEMKAGGVKNYICPVHLDVASHDPGKCPKCGKKLGLTSKEQMKAEVAKVYTCPMHSEVALSKEGKCPKCERQLIEKRKQ